MNNTGKTPTFIPLTPEEMKKEGITDMGVSRDSCGLKLTCSGVEAEMECDGPLGTCSWIVSGTTAIGITCNGHNMYCPGYGSGSSDAIEDHKPIDGNKL